MLWSVAIANPWYVKVFAFLLLLFFTLQRWLGQQSAIPPPLLPVSPQLVAGPTTVEDAIGDIRRRLEESKPPPPGVLEETGWRDVSTPVAKIGIRFDREAKPPAVLVGIRARSQDQHPEFPLVQTNNDGSILVGALPIFWGLEQWPTWFPFCDSARLVARFSADRAIWLLRFRMGFVTIDCVVLCMLSDLLKEKGCVDVIMASPPDDSAGKEWLGVTVPAHSATFRIGYEHLCLSVKPTSTSESEVFFQCKMKCIGGLERLYTKFWQVVPVRLFH
jgi:hypothetical protein